MSETLTDISTHPVITLFRADGLSSAQADALNFLHAEGIPQRKSEDWRYNPIRKVFDGLHKVSTTDSLTSIGIKSLFGDAVRTSSNRHKTAFIPALCVAGAEQLKSFQPDGSGGELRLQGPLAGEAALISAGLQVQKAQQADITIRAQGGSIGSFVAAHFEVVLGDGAQLNMTLIQRGDGAQAVSIAAELGANAQLHITTITTSGELVRNDLYVALNGRGAECILNGLYLASGKELVDNHTFVDHCVPDCTSRELYKGVLADRSVGVFNGKVLVRQDAQRTNGYQQNRNIILGDEATMNSKPELEIFADDVKCSHGSTTGQLDNEAMFYLRSRGLSEKGALQLLLGAFASEVLDGVNDSQTKSELESMVGARLESMGASR